MPVILQKEVKNTQDLDKILHLTTKYRCGMVLVVPGFVPARDNFQKWAFHLTQVTTMRLNGLERAGSGTSTRQLHKMIAGFHKIVMEVKA